MSKEFGIIGHIKGFFWLNSVFIRRYFSILIVAIILGIVCGFTMVLFYYLLIIFRIGFSYFPYFIRPIIAGVLTSLLVKYGKFNHRVMGTGAAEFIEDVNKLDSDTKIEGHSTINRAKDLLAKTFATGWTYGSGMICGLEGPGLLIGGNIGDLFSNYLFKSDTVKLDKLDAFFIGASACTGALLKAPISGALFCAELPYRNYIRYNSLLPSIVASCIAYLIFCFFFGFTPLIEITLELSPNQVNYFLLIPYLVLFGIIAGLFVFLFMGLLRGLINKLKILFEEKPGLWILPMIGAIGYGIFLYFTIPFINSDFQILFISFDSSFFTFFIHIFDKFTLSWEFLLILLILFLIGIFLSIGTMNSAGIILPLMIFGAILGGLFGVLFYPEHPELFVLLGIAAVLGASLNNPITAILLIIELTWAPFLLFPAAITTIVAYIFSGPSAIVPGQKNVWIEKENG